MRNAACFRQILYTDTLTSQSDGHSRRFPRDCNSMAKRARACRDPQSDELRVANKATIRDDLGDCEEARRQFEVLIVRMAAQYRHGLQPDFAHASPASAARTISPAEHRNTNLKRELSIELPLLAKFSSIILGGSLLTAKSYSCETMGRFGSDRPITFRRQVLASAGSTGLQFSRRKDVGVFLVTKRQDSDDCLHRL